MERLSYKAIFVLTFFHRHEVATSVIVYAEVIEYIKGLPDFPRRSHHVRQVLKEVYPYFLTYPLLGRSAALRRHLRPPHGNGLIGDMDTLIAATALERNLVVITLDHDFERVPHLETKFLPLKSASAASLRRCYSCPGNR